MREGEWKFRFLACTQFIFNITKLNGEAALLFFLLDIIYGSFLNSLHLFVHGEFLYFFRSRSDVRGSKSVSGCKIIKLFMAFDFGGSLRRRFQGLRLRSVQSLSVDKSKS